MTALRLLMYDDELACHVRTKLACTPEGTQVEVVTSQSPEEVPNLLTKGTVHAAIIPKGWVESLAGRSAVREFTADGPLDPRERGVLIVETRPVAFAPWSMDGALVLSPVTPPGLSTRVLTEFLGSLVALFSLPPITVGCPEEENFCRNPRIYVSPKADAKPTRVSTDKTTPTTLSLKDVDCNPVEFKLFLDIGRCAEVVDIQWVKRVVAKPEGSGATDRGPVRDTEKRTPEGKQPHSCNHDKQGGSFFIPWCSEHDAEITGIVLWRCISTDSDTQELPFGPFHIKIVA